MDGFGQITEKNISRSYEYVWVIKDYRNWYQANQIGHCKRSPVFVIGQDNFIFKFVLQIYLGYDLEHLDYVGICCYLTKGKINCSGFISVSIIDEDGRKYSTKSATFTSVGLSFVTNFTFKDFVLKQDLLTKPMLLPRGELRIQISIHGISAIDTPIITDTEMFALHKVESEILGKVLDAGKYADFKFVVGDKEFGVHRAILAAQSPVFEAMFDSKMRESNEGKVDIVDIEVEVMEKLLHFVYISELKNIDDIADKLLVAAEKYQLEKLKQLCEDILVKQLSLKNVYDALHLADENTAENLKENAMKFFHCNAKELAAEEDFKAHFDALPGLFKTDIVCALINKI